MASKTKNLSSKNVEIDPVEEMIKKTGCIEKHYAVQDCMFEHDDWRKCQHVVGEFRQCMAAYYKKREKEGFKS